MIVGFEKVRQHAQQRLQRRKDSRLEDHLDLFKKFLCVEDQRLKMQHRNTLEGQAVCRRRAQLMDLLISRGFEIAVEEFREGKKSKDTATCAVVAVGGYGRGELNFHSDIDIMFLSGGTVGEFGKFVLNKILYLLWDLGMTVGHSIRSIPEAMQICSTDLVSRTALFESRCLAGDKFLFHHLQQKLEERFAQVPRVVQAYVGDKMREREDRHHKFGSSMYLQEPNVKESIGGIRDLHNVLWVMRLKYGSLDLSLARTHHLLNDSEMRSLQKSYDFLLAVRNELHLCSGKKMDILTRQYQPAIAKVFGFKDKGDLTAAELFMHKYYLRVRNVSFLSGAILSKLKEPLSLREKSMRFLKRKDLDFGLMEIDGTIFLAKNTPDIFRKNPSLMMRVFDIAQERNAVLHEDLKALLRNNLLMVQKKFQASKEVYACFLRILSRKGRVGPALRCMHETGFLGKYIPEFGKITCQVQDSEYHMYTTDEHSLKAIEFVDTLFTADCKADTAIRQAAANLTRPDLLYLSLILHDIGKLDHDDHVSLGLLLAQRALKRMPCPAEDAQKVLFLIREHLSMSHIAQRRDLEDRKTILDFSVLVKDMDNLRGLLALSYADANAVAPGIWTHWKEALMVELAQKTEEWLSGKALQTIGSPETMRETARKVQELAGNRLSPRAVERHLEAMPSLYPVFTPPALVASHLTLVEALQDKPFVLSWSTPSGNEAMREVTVCMKDRLGLFAKLAGCFSLNDINIISAQINTRSDGIVLDTFRVSDASGTLPLSSRSMQRFEDDLRKVLEGGMDLDAQMRRHEEKIKARLLPAKKIKPVVLLNNEISQTKSVLEIQAMDRIGLLFHVSKALVTLNLNISAAKISTERFLVYDVFYVTDERFRKIEDAAQTERILSCLQRELETFPC